MRNSYWTSLCVSLLLFGIVLTCTGCRIFDFFGKDSSAQGNSSYTRPAIPETLEQEQSAVKARLNEFTQALEAKDVEKAVALCSRTEEYREAFQNNKDKMPLLGEMLKNAKLTTVGAYNSNGCRIGGVSVDIASTTFTINMIKGYGEWYFQDF